MLLEIEIQNRLLGITPSHEQQLRYATIFRMSSELAFSTAYVDGWLAALKNIERRQQMQYKIQGSVAEIERLAPLFLGYSFIMKNNVLTVLTDTDDDSDLLLFLSMVNAPVMIDYMTQTIIKITL